MRLLITALLLISSIDQMESKKFTRCGLARLLHYKYYFRKASLPDWLCLVREESGFSTRTVTRRNRSGSLNFGLFQINDEDWCGRGYVGGRCRVNCDDFLTDDITASVQCAKLIHRMEGFSAWYGWRNYCRNRLPCVDCCFQNKNLFTLVLH